MEVNRQCEEMEENMMRLERENRDYGRELQGMRGDVKRKSDEIYEKNREIERLQDNIQRL